MANGHTDNQVNEIESYFSLFCKNVMNENHEFANFKINTHKTLNRQLIIAYFTYTLIKCDYKKFSGLPRTICCVALGANPRRLIKFLN